MLKGKNTVITGGRRGIGKAILRLFAENHSNIWCVATAFDQPFLEEIKELEEKYQVWIKPIKADLSQRSDVRRIVSDISSEKAPINILINNAGINYRGTFLMTSLEDMDRLMQVNYFAPVQLSQLFAKKMIRQREGIIINIGSMSGLEHNTGHFAYGVSKAALLWATQTMSRELAPYGIRVNAVAPGVVDTGINKGNENVIAENVLSRMNIKRPGNAEEIAQAVLFLAGPGASFVSGHILRVDGGRFEA